MDTYIITDEYINTLTVTEFQNVLYSSAPLVYYTFPDSESELFFYKCLGLCSKKSNDIKPLYHKSSDGKSVELCKIRGFKKYSNDNFSSFQILIETASGAKTPINSMYLKDMQKSSFGTTLYTEG